MAAPGGLRRRRDMDGTPLRNFLEIPYDELEDRNLAIKEQRIARKDPKEIADQSARILSDEKRLKAITVCFTDLEGRLHMLDYDKKFLLKSQDNLTFDGSSIRGFSQQHESDLRLVIDWGALYWLPADVFGPGKVLGVALVKNRRGPPFGGRFRGRAKELADQNFAKDKAVCHVANEIEGFLFQGRAPNRAHPE